MSQHALPCPFCGHAVDLTDPDVLYPSGVGWRDHENGLRSYHSAREVPQEQWCFALHCATTSGGCGAQMNADSKEEALERWNRRV